MKKIQKNIVSLFIVFTMIFMNCFSSVFAASTDVFKLNVNAMKTITTGSGVEISKPTTFEFSGKVYLVGDSTVCEYDEKTVTTLDRQGWGMRLGDHFNEELTITNLALSGRSTRSFINEKNYTRLLNELGEGDYVFIQLAHNDQKDDERGTTPGLDLDTLDEEGKNAEGVYSYEWFLMNKYIEPALERGAMPVLVTPITRRSSSGKANYKDHVPYQEAMKKLAEEYNIPCLDLMTKTVETYIAIYNEGGAEATAALHALKVSGETIGIDNTHLSVKGATLVSGLVVEGIKELGLPLVSYLKAEDTDETPETPHNLLVAGEILS